MTSMNTMRTKKTGEETAVQAFENQPETMAVSQTNGVTGTRKAQLNFAVGFASMPVSGAQLIVHEVGSALYATGGNIPGIEKLLGLEPGDSCMYSVDSSGALQAKTVYKANGEIVFNDGEDVVIRGDAMNTYLTTTFSVSTAFGPSGPATTQIPANALNDTLKV